MPNTQLPSDRMRAGRKARIRTQTRAAFRCADCREVYDWQPLEILSTYTRRDGTEGRTYGGPKCPKCGCGTINPCRVKD